ncbi:MAG TPA: DNA polymerase IV [Candidatus Methanoperedens sp.]
MEPRIILHVDMDYFFAQCEERERPEIKGRPVVVCVYSGRSKDSGAVSTCNYAARKLGVKAGMPISLAKKLAPSAIFLPVNMELYLGVSDEIMEVLRVNCGTLEKESVDEAFCDITGIVPDLNEAGIFAARIKEEIREKVGLTCSVGIASNKLVSKMASDFKKPDGLTVVKPDETFSFLFPLDITELPGVGKKTGGRLNELGIKTIGELAELPREMLVREFGRVKGEWLKLASHGIDNTPVMEREGTEQIGRMITLKNDTRERTIILDAVNKLSEDVHRKLETRKLRFKSVSFVAVSTDLKIHTRTHTLNMPARDMETIRKTAGDLVEMFLAEHPLSLRRVGVRVANFEEEKGQRTLGDFLLL